LTQLKTIILMQVNKEIIHSLNGILMKGEELTPLDFYHYIPIFKNIFSQYKIDNINYLYGVFICEAMFCIIDNKKVLSRQNMGVNLGLTKHTLMKIKKLYQISQTFEGWLELADKYNTYSYSKIYYGLLNRRRDYKRHRMNVEMQRFADNIMKGIIDPENPKYKSTLAMYNYILRNTPRPLALDNKYYLENTFCSHCMKLNPKPQVVNHIVAFKFNRGVIKTTLCNKCKSEDKLPIIENVLFIQSQYATILESILDNKLINDEYKYQTITTTKTKNQKTLDV